MYICIYLPGNVDTCDPAHATDKGVLTFDIEEPVSNAPIAKDDLYTVYEGTAITGNVINNDSDPDDDELSVKSAVIKPIGGGSPIPISLGDPVNTLNYRSAFTEICTNKSNLVMHRP